MALLVTNHLWKPEVAGAAHEYVGDDEAPEGETHSSVAVTGPGALAAYDSRVSNANFDVLEAYRRGTGQPPEKRPTGVSHPGRGSTSQFHNTVLRATKDLPTGSEIMLDYPLPNEDGAAGEEIDDDGTILESDYAKIDETILEMVAFFDKHEAHLDDEAKQQIYRFLTEDFMDAAVGPVKAAKIGQLFPPTPDELYKVRDAGGIALYNNKGSSSSRLKQLQWLETNGFCMDNLRPGPSTIPNAGQGAFANRKIPEGGLVTPVPLLHIPDQISLNTYTLYYTEDGVLAREEDFSRGTQLAMNYVFGHPESSMVFLPFGPHAALINHGDEPNAKVQWSTHAGHNQDWFDVPPHVLLQHDEYYTIGLMMEVVATRDIQPEEEVLIDYGADWKKAWHEHVKGWEESIRAGEIDTNWPVRAADLNDEHRTTFFKTEEEQEKEPYPLGVTLKAFIFADDTTVAEGTEDDPLVWTETAERTSFGVRDLYDVSIVGREELTESGNGDSSQTPSYVYTVMIPGTTDREEDFLFVSGVPHKVLVFVDDAETGDEFTTEQPFRHYIGIPDDVFPKGAWRNLA